MRKHHRKFIPRSGKGRNQEPRYSLRAERAWRPFRLIEEDIDLNFGKYLQYRYTNTSGHNLRNKVAHGQLKYSEANFTQVSTIIFDILRVGARINAEYREV
ncbi:DUF4209 domain-containing protein [Halopenitus persicus]|uniref:DUF4209 domain-containing protein n=1 Tax=Halopenitus persicus TaxID=1048396 RepID=UPI00373FD2A8